jgi:hypothetical protein
MGPSGPEGFEVIQHQAADLTQLIVVGGEQGWISPQQPPVLAAQHVVQKAEVAVDRLEVGILAAKQRLDIAVGVLELAFQTLHPRFAHELRGLPQ